MNSFPFDEEKSIAAVLYIIEKVGGSIDMHKLAKILYFADQKHLVKYGRTVVGDEYVPMEFGPVPSHIYSAVKDINKAMSYKLFAKYLSLDLSAGMRVIRSFSKPNLDELSKSDVACVDEAIRENQDLSFDELVKKSHKKAWTNAAQKNLRFISIEDIATEAGATEEMVEYIKDNMSDYNLVLPKFSAPCHC